MEESSLVSSKEMPETTSATGSLAEEMAQETNQNNEVKVKEEDELLPPSFHRTLTKVLIDPGTWNCDYHISHESPVTYYIDQDKLPNDNMCISHCLGDPMGTPFFGIDIDSKLPLQLLSSLVHQ